MPDADLVPLLGLLIAHVVGDFVLQPHRWVESRRRHGAASPALYLHASVHGLLSLAVLWSAGAFTGAAIAALGIMVSHALIDLVKSRLPGDKLRWFLTDQLAHLAIAVGIWLWWLGSLAPLQLWLGNLASPQGLLVLLAYLLVTRPLSFAISLGLRAWAQQIPESGTLFAAGAWIGMLERVLVLTLVLADAMTVVGFLATAKTVLRFGDLREQKDRRLTEYVLLGTLLSLASSVMLGIMVRALLLGA